MLRFETTYLHDYNEKPVQPVYNRKEPVRNDRDNTISAPYNTYLKLDNDEKPLLFDEQYANEYLNKFSKNQPKLAERYFKTPIDCELVKQHLAKYKHSVYQVDYCKADIKGWQTMAEREEKYRMRIPKFDPAYTTYLSSYRNPTIINENALKTRSQVRQMDNLGSHFLAPMTGKSEYGTVINALGGEIIKDQMYGPIIHPNCGCLEHNL